MLGVSVVVLSWSCMLMTRQYTYASGASVEECTTKINGALNNINEWMENNSLTLNTQKSTYMVFKRKQNRIVSVEDSVRVNGTSLERVDCMKFLGVTLDENLL